MKIRLRLGNVPNLIHIDIFNELETIIDYCWAVYNTSHNQYTIRLLNDHQQLIDILIKENICTIINSNETDIIILALTKSALLQVI